jgi:AcrR family transcriptional regulator
MDANRKRPQAPVHPRPRGRPRRDGAGMPELSREVVIERAFEMTRTERLDALSMVRVAAELGISPALMHYYLNSRDALTSGVVNRFSRAVCEATPAPTDQPRADIEAVMRATYTVMLAHPGVVDYLASHNRFRLVQQVGEGEVDYGLRSLELLTSAVMRAGYDQHDTAMLSHLLRMFVLACGQAEARFQTPGFHKGFLDKTVSRLEPAEFPGLHHTLRAFATLDGRTVFDRGLQMLIDGFGASKATSAGTATRGTASQVPRRPAARRGPGGG